MKQKNAYKVCMLFAVSLLTTFCVQAQAVMLNADGPGNTYELINSVLAPGYDVVENPECVHPAFGRHITEVFDAVLNTNVFEFYSHVTEDNDRCINFDRQRIEIKTYDQSPANLIGTLGESITYKWRFKMPTGFQPSSNFTHIHQIKPVNGDDGDPLFTLTARKGTPNKLELIHNNITKVAIVNLSLFEGQWVEATEIVKVGASGTYSIVINRVSDNVTILSYSSSDIMTIRPTNDFIRPKWGIYRSLNTPADLRDEAVRFNAFSIEENNVVLPIKLLSFNAVLNGSKVDVGWVTASEENSRTFTVEKSADGINFRSIGIISAAGNSNSIINYQFVDAYPVTKEIFYRLKQTDFDGFSQYSEIVLIKFNVVKQLFIYPNPVKDQINFQIPITKGAVSVQVTDMYGRSIITITGLIPQVINSLKNNVLVLKLGYYFISIKNEEEIYQGKILKI
ncbi:MAG: T9SS type A sorting domain-containing protein [Chitinophagaceae bacterium]